MNRLGNALRRLRAEKGFTQNSLANAAGVSSKLISTWETADPDTVQPVKYASVAKALGLTPEQLDREWRTEFVLAPDWQKIFAQVSASERANAMAELMKGIRSAPLRRSLERALKELREPPSHRINIG